MILDIVVILNILTDAGTVGFKLVWTLIVLLLPVAGLLLYLITGRELMAA